MGEHKESQGLEQSGALKGDSIMRSRELLGQPMEANIFKLGGTWDMTVREGKRVGIGGLDDEELKRLQQQAGLASDTSREARIAADKRLSKLLDVRFKAAQPEQVDAAEHLSSWCRDKATGESFGDFAHGKFTSLFSGDSAHFHTSMVAPMVSTLLEKAKNEPSKPLLGGQGTDTVDIAILSIWDALTYDTNLPPLILTGANTPHELPNSDAPRNFIDLAKVSHADLASGAYWVFHGDLYQAADLVKFDPQETRKLEGHSTFYAPHQTARSIDALIDSGQSSNWQKCMAPGPEHVASRITTEALYEASNSVYVADLTDQNSGWMNMDRIFDPEVKAVVVAAHSFGSVDNEIRMDLVNAAKQGKLIVSTSRALIGEINENYESALLGANQDPRELGGSGKRIISGHRLNKTIARALVTRALLEGLDQQETQQLFDTYAESRGMIN